MAILINPGRSMPQDSMRRCGNTTTLYCVNPTVDGGGGGGAWVGGVEKEWISDAIRHGMLTQLLAREVGGASWKWRS